MIENIMHKVQPADAADNELFKKSTMEYSLLCVSRSKVKRSRGENIVQKKTIIDFSNYSHRRRMLSLRRQFSGIIEGQRIIRNRCGWKHRRDFIWGGFRFRGRSLIRRKWKCSLRSAERSSVLRRSEQLFLPQLRRFHSIRRSELRRIPYQYGSRNRQYHHSDQYTS